MTGKTKKNKTATTSGPSERELLEEVLVIAKTAATRLAKYTSDVDEMTCDISNYERIVNDTDCEYKRAIERVLMRRAQRRAAYKQQKSVEALQAAEDLLKQAEEHRRKSECLGSDRAQLATGGRR